MIGMILRTVIYILLLTFPWVLTSQNLPQMSSVHWDKYVYNPAFAGVTGSTEITAHFRSQWQGIQGQPQTQMLSAYTPVDVISSAVGILISGDRIGQVKSQNFAATYSYQLSLPFGELSAGLLAGMDRKTFFGADWRAPEGEYGSGGSSHNDPILSDENISGVAPRLDVGLYLVTRSFEIGLSSQNVSPFTYSVSGVGTEGETRQTRSYVLQASYFYEYSDEWLFMPSVVLKTNGQLTQAEAGVGADYQGVLKGGLYFRGYNSSSVDALIFQVGYQFAERAYVYYSFDLGLSGLRQVHDNSHEVSLRYIINEPLFKIKREKVIYNPRFIE